MIFYITDGVNTYVSTEANRMCLSIGSACRNLFLILCSSFLSLPLFSSTGALICWAYGQAFLTPRNTNPNTGLGDFDSTRPSTANNSARNSPEPSNSTKNPAGTAYLEAMCTRTPEDLISVDDSVKTHTKGESE